MTKILLIRLIRSIVFCAFFSTPIAAGTQSNLDNVCRQIAGILETVPGLNGHKRNAVIDFNDSNNEAIKREGCEVSLMGDTIHLSDVEFFFKKYWANGWESLPRYSGTSAEGSNTGWFLPLGEIGEGIYCDESYSWSRIPEEKGPDNFFLIIQCMTAKKVVLID